MTRNDLKATHVIKATPKGFSVWPDNEWDGCDRWFTGSSAASRLVSYVNATVARGKTFRFEDDAWEKFQAMEAEYLRKIALRPKLKRRDGFVFRSADIETHSPSLSQGPSGQ